MFALVILCFLVFLSSIVFLIKPLWIINTRIKAAILMGSSFFLFFVFALIGALTDPDIQKQTSAEQAKQLEEKKQAESKNKPDQKTKQDPEKEAEDKYKAFILPALVAIQQDMQSLGKQMSEPKLSEDKWIVDVAISLSIFKGDSEKIINYKGPVPTKYKPAHEKLRLAAKQFYKVSVELPKAIDNRDAKQLTELAGVLTKGTQYMEEANKLLPKQ